MLQFVLLAAFVIPAILFMLTQQNILKAIQPENRLMKPGLVWLQLIPIFGQVWQFFVVLRIANSIQKEMVSRQDDSILGFSDASAVEELGKRPTLAIGIACCILTTTPFITNLGFSFDQESWVTKFVLLSFLSGTTCWIIYWVRLAQYKKKLGSLS